MTTLHKPRLLADDFVFLESPKWHGGRLWVSDVFDHRVYAVDTSGHRELVCEMHRPTGLGFLPDGALIVVDAEARKLMRFQAGVLREYADLSRHAAGHLNDFAIDGSGRTYVGNFGYDYDGGDAPRTTSLHRVDPDGSITAVAEVDFPNGSVVVNGGRTLLVAETWARRVVAFDLDAEGSLPNRRVFADLGKREPDGMCADAEDAIWVGCFNTGEFIRVLDGGQVTNSVKFDGAAGISCVLGGEDGRTLFMTTYMGSVDEIAAKRRKGAIFTLDVDVAAPGQA